MSNVGVQQLNQNIPITQNGQTVQVVRQTTQVIVQELGQQGAKGDKGDKGDNGMDGAANLGGYPIAVSNPQAGDLIRFSGDEWENNPLVDGGNF